MQKIVLSLLVVGSCLFGTVSMAAASPTTPSSCGSQLLAKYGDEKLRHIGPGEFLSPYDEPIAAGKAETVPQFCARVDQRRAVLAAKDQAVASAKQAEAAAQNKQAEAEQATQREKDSHKRDDAVWTWLWVLAPFGGLLVGWIGIRYLLWPLILWRPTGDILRSYGFNVPRRRRGLGSRSCHTPKHYLV
jgi:hypothetical protein